MPTLADLNRVATTPERAAVAFVIRCLGTLFGAGGVYLMVDDAMAHRPVTPGYVALAVFFVLAHVIAFRIRRGGSDFGRVLEIRAFEVATIQVARLGHSGGRVALRDAEGMELASLLTFDAKKLAVIREVAVALAPHAKLVAEDVAETGAQLATAQVNQKQALANLAEQDRAREAAELARLPGGPKSP